AGFAGAIPRFPRSPGVGRVEDRKLEFRKRSAAEEIAPGRAALEGSDRLAVAVGGEISCDERDRRPQRRLIAIEEDQVVANEPGRRLLDRGEVPGKVPNSAARIQPPTRGKTGGVAGHELRGIVGGEVLARIPPLPAVQARQ